MSSSTSHNFRLPKRSSEDAGTDAGASKDAVFNTQGSMKWDREMSEKLKARLAAAEDEAANAEASSEDAIKADTGKASGINYADYDYSDYDNFDGPGFMPLDAEDEDFEDNARFTNSEEDLSDYNDWDGERYQAPESHAQVHSAFGKARQTKERIAWDTSFNEDSAINYQADYQKASRKKSWVSRDNFNVKTVLITLAMLALVGAGVWLLIQQNTQVNQATQESVSGKFVSGETAATETEASDIDISVTAVGSINFDKGVAEYIEENGAKNLLSPVMSELNQSDLLIGNLDSALSSGGEESFANSVRYRGLPRSIETLKSAGFEFVSLASDHIMDYGQEALDDTISSLNNANIKYAGAGDDEEAAWASKSDQVLGTKVAYLAFTDVYMTRHLSGEDQAGVAGNIDTEAMLKAIEDAKKDAAFVVVCMHWGNEYSAYTNWTQREQAHAIIDAGADVIIGTHPTLLQGLEFYEDGLIAYSLSSFIYDHDSTSAGQSVILNFHLTEKGVQSVSAVPIYLEDETGVPTVVSGETATTILNNLEARSTNCSFAIENGQASVSKASEESESSSSSTSE